MQIDEENTYTITGGPLKPHEYIQIKREITAADDAWIQNHSTAIAGTKKNPQIHLTIGDVKLALLKRMILRWQLTKTVKAPDGTETQVDIPLTEKAVEDLPRRISSFIDKKINELNPDEEEDEEDFTHAANGHYTGSSQPTKILHPKA